MRPSPRAAPRRVRPAAATWLLLAATACGGGRSSVDLDQPISGLTTGTRPLQVVLHEVAERAPRGASLRVCRSLASAPVTVEPGDSPTLRALLERLAADVGTDLAPAGRGLKGGEALPTLRCPSGRGDYLIIGRPPAG